MKDKNVERSIFQTLKESDRYLSGEVLAKHLRISRQALWKHIAKLSAKGYHICAVPHLGYKLISSPDKLYPWEIQYALRTTWVGREIHYLPVVDSTQSLAWELGLKGAPAGALIVSETQKQGRGRMGRQWISPKGGIYFSLILRPDFIAVNQIPQITLLIGLSCYHGIRNAAGVECSLKWPNDLILNDKKLGGILCEVHAEQDTVHFMVVGIGINVNTRDLPGNAISLFLYGKKEFSRQMIIRCILESIEEYYQRARKEAIAPILKEWERCCTLWGRRVCVNSLHKEKEGRAIGIDEQGYLLLRSDAGTIERISAGDVVKCNVN